MDDLRLGSSVPRFNVLLREHRERLQLSQEELAARSGLSTRAIRYLENGGVRRPRLGSVRLLADGLRLSGPTRAEFELAASRGTEPKPATSSAKGEETTAPPALLPLTVPTFVGRDAEIASLDLLLAADGDAAPVVVSVSGPAGVGKTALAVHWAHRIRASFPDGQLYINLRGFAAMGSPVRPGEAVRAFLDALAVPQAADPHGPDRAGRPLP